MGGIFSWLADHLGGLFGSGLSGLLDAVTEPLVVLGLTVFALALGFFSLSYLNRRRTLRDQQRMAALIKGLHYAGVSPQALARPKPDPREHAMKGVRWLFGSVGLSSALYGYQTLQPAADPSDALRGAIVGIIPGAIALAHFLCSWICSRQQAAPAPTAPSRQVYRVARRRF
jgi:hypothetical protein